MEFEYWDAKIYNNVVSIGMGVVTTVILPVSVLDFAGLIPGFQKFNENDEIVKLNLYYTNYKKISKYNMELTLLFRHSKIVWLNL